MPDTSNKTRERLSRGMRIGIAAAILPALLFYVFVVPMLAATASQLGPWGVGFGAFMLVQLWMLVALFALEAAGSFYGFVPRLPKPLAILGRASSTLKHLPTSGGILMMFVSYIAFVYAYGVLYAFVASVDLAAFGSSLRGSDAIYFSVITAATVGYGDIAPKTSLAKWIVISEILLSLLYVVLLFSAAANALQRRRSTVAPSLADSQTDAGEEAHEP